MTTGHKLWIQPPPTWYEGIPLSMSPSLKLTYSIEPIIETKLVPRFEITTNLLEPALPAIQLSYTLNIP